MEDKFVFFAKTVQLNSFFFFFSNVEIKKILCMWKLCLPGLLETITRNGLRHIVHTQLQYSSHALVICNYLFLDYFILVVIYLFIFGREGFG